MLPWRVYLLLLPFQLPFCHRLSILPFIKYSYQLAMFPVPPPGSRSKQLKQSSGSNPRVITSLPSSPDYSAASHASSFGNCTCDLSIWKEEKKWILVIQAFYSKNGKMYIPQKVSSGLKILVRECPPPNHDKTIIIITATTDWVFTDDRDRFKGSEPLSLTLKLTM